MSSGNETERKFLVRNNGWKTEGLTGVPITQWYLPEHGGAFKSIHLTPDLEGRGTMTFSIDAVPTFSIQVPSKAMQAFGEKGRKQVLDSRGRIQLSDRVEMRIRKKGDEYLLTLKAGTEDPATRYEMEFPVESWWARIIAEHCPDSLQKKRYEVMVGDQKWEVDEYLGSLRGLFVAEAEIDSPDAPLTLPSWLNPEDEVTGQKQYSNRALAHTASSVKEAIRLTPGH